MGLCVICFNDFCCSWNSENRLFREDRKWKTQPKANSTKSGGLQRQITLNAKEVEGKYFKITDNTSSWIELYRLIWYDQVEGRFRLSGAGHFNNEYDTRNAAAKECEEALVGKVRKLQRTTETFTTEYYTLMQLRWWSFTHDLDEDTREKIIFTHWGRLPLAIHMSCWKLAQWIMGPSLLDYDKNLELFAGIMLRLFLHHTHIWYDSEKRVHCGLARDPYRIPEVQQLIARSKEEKKRRRRRKRQLRTSRLSRLPIEVLELILDYLTVIETVKVERGLSIVVGERYWRHRASWDLVEVDELAGEEEAIDWRYLCINLDKMIRRDEAFNNRNHVFRILRSYVKPEFLSKLGEEDYPSLKQVIVEYQKEMTKSSG